MRKPFSIATLLFLLVIFLGSCASIQKRRYNSGFSVLWNQKNRYSAIEVSPKTKAAINNRIEITEEKSELLPIESFNTGKPGNKENKFFESELRTKHNIGFSADIEKNNYKYFTTRLSEEIKVKDSSKKTLTQTLNQLPREPMGNIAFWLVIGALALWLIMVVVTAGMGATATLPTVFYLLGYLQGIALLVGFILGLLSLKKYDVNPGVYRGRGRPKIAVIITTILLVIALLVLFVFFLLVLALI